MLPPADQLSPRIATTSARPGSSSQGHRLSRRSRKGCLTCRERKVKCDETPTTCNNCRRLSLNCAWVDGRARESRSSLRSSSPNRSTNGIRPSRDTMQGANDPLRYSDSGNDEPSQDRRRTLNPGPLYAMSSEYNLDILLSAYFCHIHPIQANGFIHRPTLERDIRQKSAHPLTVKAICAVAASFLVKGYDASASRTPSDPEGWVEDLKSALMLDTERIGYPKLIAALCVIQHEFGVGRNASAWTICALAVRLALAMGLNHEDGSSYHFVEREFRRRLMWSVYACDSMCHGGLNDYMLLSQDTVRIPLPASEHHYSLSIEPTDRPWLMDARAGIDCLPQGTDGLMSRYLRLMCLRTSILQYVKSKARQPTAIWDPSSPFHDLTGELKRWKDSLPAELHFSVDNLYARRASHELGALCLLHCWHDQLHCSLYRLALPGFDESACAASLAEAPEGWVDKLRHATYIRATALLHKFSLLRHSFAEHVPESWQFATLALEATRNILQYLAIAHPGGLDQDRHQAILRDFTDMVETVAKMQPHLRGTRVKVRDLLRILDRHGFRVEADHLRTSPDSVRASTPARGPILSRLPMFRRHLRHPDLEGHPAISPTSLVESDIVDPVTQEPIQASPTSNNSNYLSTSRSTFSDDQLGISSNSNALVMTPADYLSWFPAMEATVDAVEPDESLWLHMGGPDIPGFNLDGFADTWTAAGLAGPDDGYPENTMFWSSREEQT